MALRLYEGKSLVDHYAKYRPSYTTDLFKTIVKYYDEGKGPDCNYELAVDVGCGNGRSSLPLAEYFKHVIGSDISPAQISMAPKNNEGVEFLLCEAENLGFLQDNSVDVLTVGTAFHFFDAQKFYSEATRVLKPGGVLAIYSYSYPDLEEEEGQRLYLEHRRLMQPLDLIDYSRMDDMYMQYEIPLSEVRRMRNIDALNIKMQLSVSDFIGYLQTDHAWTIYLEANPNTDHLERMKSRFADVYNALNGENNPVINFTCHLILVLGRKPAL